MNQYYDSILSILSILHYMILYNYDLLREDSINSFILIFLVILQYYIINL